MCESQNLVLTDYIVLYIHINFLCDLFMLIAKLSAKSYPFENCVIILNYVFYFMDLPIVIKYY